MSVYLYEEALIERFKEITGDDRISIIPPESSISFLAQIGSKDKVDFPAIVLTRGPVTINGDLRNQVQYLKGETSRYNKEDNTAVKARLIPIKINWTVNVYAVDRRTCDEIIRELVFFFMTKPRFYAQIPYDLGINQNFDVILDDEIADNSDLVEFPEHGELFRETLSIHTDNAHFYSSKRQYLTKAETSVDPDLNK